MRTPLIDQFTLKKIKKIKGGGMDVAYETTEAVGQEIYYDENNVRSSKEPHPDLTTPLRQLAGYVAKIMQLDTAASVVKNKEFKATPDQIEAAETAAAILTNKISINGISITGKDDKRIVKILAVYQPDSLQTLAINPRIMLSSEVYGFEADIEELTEVIEKEAYAYIFEDKKAQLDLFDE